MSEMYSLKVNGVDYPVAADLDRNLLSVLRTEVGLTGTKEGCDDCECGACMVLLDGQPVNSCSYLAVQAQGRTVTTIEGAAAPDGSYSPVQEGFRQEHGLQCGYCTPGMIMAATALLADNPDPTREQIREGLEGNLCRCTGYQNIVRAVKAGAQAMRTDSRGSSSTTGGSMAPAGAGSACAGRVARATKNAAARPA